MTEEYSKKIEKIIEYLKVLTIILFIFLATFSIIYKLDDCSVCDLYYEGEEYDGKGFMEVYEKKCFSRRTNITYKTPQLNLSNG